MNLHTQARTCPASRTLLVRRILREHWSGYQAAIAAGVSTSTYATREASSMQTWTNSSGRDSNPRPRVREASPLRFRLRVTPKGWNTKFTHRPSVASIESSKIQNCRRETDTHAPNKVRLPPVLRASPLHASFFPPWWVAKLPRLGRAIGSMRSNESE
ncbi:MAG: leucine zipper domain-containing protein [Myxococcaceae bacterium]